MITNMAQFGKDLAAFEKRVVELAKQLEDSEEKKRALRDAGQILVNAMQSKVRVSDRVLYRYSNKKIVAVYYPGNLKRSIRILEHMADTRNTYVGVKRMPKGKGKGTFAGENADGYYARFEEYGPRGKPFMRPAIMETQGQIMRMLENYIARQAQRQLG